MSKKAVPLQRIYKKQRCVCPSNLAREVDLGIIYRVMKITFPSVRVVLRHRPFIWRKRGVSGTEKSSTFAAKIKCPASQAGAVHYKRE